MLVRQRTRAAGGAKEFFNGHPIDGRPVNFNSNNNCKIINKSSSTLLKVYLIER